MADRPAARDEDRLPWLEPFGEGEKARRRKPRSRTALVGLLVAFFGMGLAVAFSLGYRFAGSPADAPAPTKAEQPQRTATVQFPLAPPVPLPKVELIAPQAVVEPPVEPPKVAVAPKPEPKPVAKKAKAPKRYAKRRPILRPFKLTKRPPLEPAPPPVSKQPAPPPPPPPGPKGRMIQLGAYSTERQAESAWRTLVFRYPYLKSKPKVVVPTKPIGGWTYHRLRIGTESQAQSVVICQHLQKRGQSCIVLY